MLTASGPGGYFKQLYTDPRRALSLRPRLASDLNFIVHHAHLVAVDFNSRTIGPGAIAHFEAPGMPGASHSPVMHFAGAQRGAHMWASIVDGEILAARVEHCHQPLPYGHRNPLSFGNRTNLGDGDEVAGGPLSLVICHLSFVANY